MKNRVVVGVVAVGAALLALRFLRGSGEFREKMFERMPDTAPPKWMFLNIKAIRENTDRILERLGAEPILPVGGKAGTAA